MKRILIVTLASAALTGCAASSKEVVSNLQSRYIGQSVNNLIAQFGPPASTFQMVGGDVAYEWRLSENTQFAADRYGGSIATNHCKVRVVAAPKGDVKSLMTEDVNAGGGLLGAVGAYGSLCAHYLHMPASS